MTQLAAVVKHFEHLALLVFYLAFLPGQFQIELASRTCRNAAEDSGIRRKREWNLSQLVHPHSGGDDYCCYLRDIHRPLTNDVTSEDVVGRAVDD